MSATSATSATREATERASTLPPNGWHISGDQVAGTRPARAPHSRLIADLRLTAVHGPALRQFACQMSTQSELAMACTRSCVSVNVGYKRNTWHEKNLILILVICSERRHVVYCSSQRNGAEIGPRIWKTRAPDLRPRGEWRRGKRKRQSRSSDMPTRNAEAEAVPGRRLVPPMGHLVAQSRRTERTQLAIAD